MSRLFIFFIMLWAGICAAQTPMSDGYFDPARDPVAVMANGRLRFVISEMVVLRSISANFERVGAIEKVDKRFWDNHWFLILESRHSADMTESVYVMVRLQPNTKGEYFAEPWWMACTGNSCSSCQYADELEGCICLYDKPGEPGVSGFCYHTTSAEPLLVKVPLK
jgi:hypothetical protein